MNPALELLLGSLEHLSDQFRELRDGVQKAIRIADDDPEMALTRARKVLEYVVRDVYQHRINEPPGTRPLENLLQRLVKDGFFPDRLDAYANTIRKLGNVGTHTFGEKITVADVYQSLSQLSYVLEWYFEQERPEALAGRPAPERPPTPVKSPEPPATAAPGTPVAVVPKGLRSFDAKDADFFLDLLPGPRDKDGLPASLRFWKHRIEQGDEPTFTVGVIYGPSGCGKSSLVKAGLLPRLARRVLTVYVEATADDTEARLLKGLRMRCSSLPGDLDLTGTMTALRQGLGPSNGQKVLVVVDQFEQWLHASREGQKSELAQALRQCDGEHLQCVVMVRDDFWMALTRFMSDLHIELVQGQNIAPVDLFDPIHARNVLAAFGRALGRLPSDLSGEQESFLDQAVAGLSQDGRVISVRLALFAEMVKGKPWTPATLKEVGGTEGVGVSFLEETFSSRTASPRHRARQQAARAVLRALLPEQGTDIKGNMKSHAQLLEASGYSRRPQEFEELLRILDSEVRLITPTEPASVDSETGEGQAGVSERYYQLTHDYLVHSLREWLTRKQRETRRGRAELRLEERAALWSAKPEARHLPAWWEWADIRLLTRKKDWTPPQRKMMRKAGRYHAVRGVALAVMLLAVAVAGLVIRGRVIEENQATNAAGLVRQLLDAEMVQVPAIITEMKDHRRWTDPLLRQAYQEAEAGKDARKQLHASLALLPVDDGQVEYLYGRLLDAEPQDVVVIRDALQPHEGALVERLWGVVGQPPGDDEGQRLRAACALAAYDADSPRWDGAGGPVVGQLVAVNPIVSGFWIEGFRPVTGRLLAPLSAVFRDRGEGRTTERSLATSVLADYARDRPDLLADLVQDADERQFAVLFPLLDAHRGRAAALLRKTVDQVLGSKTTEEEKDALARRQANAAVALLRMGEADKVWPLLPRTPDPRVRSYLIHRLSPLGADARAVVRRLDGEREVSGRRALLLALGEYGEKGLAPGQREELLPRLFDLYRGEPDAGLHAAAEWLLLQWGRQDSLDEMGRKWATGKQGREERLDGIRRELAEGEREARWYVNGQGQTLVVIPGPVTFLMGSPPEEAGREGGAEGKEEMRHEKRIGRSFVIAARGVTVEQFLRFRKGRNYSKEYSPTGDCPMNSVSWFAAAAYCNWLSEQEGIAPGEWCYLPNADGEYADGMSLAPDYLHKTGYRLPSEAEWECACRAGALTGRYYGEGEELLGRYAWYTKNSRDRGMLPGEPGRLGVPGGRLKPNDFGLFDMLGNAWEWCQDRVADYRPGEDVEDSTAVKANESRLLRGGCFYTQARFVRCAYRDKSVPGYVMGNNGFRPARTFR